MKSKEEYKQSKAVKTPKNRHLDVIVKAHELYALPSTKQNLDDKTALIDDEGFESGFGEPKKNYETLVFKDYQVTWDIKVEDKNGRDKGYDVELVSISHNTTPPDNPNFFNENQLKPGGNKKTITGTITKLPHFPDIDDNYTINFNIVYDGVPHYFPLDPKLKANM